MGLFDNIRCHFPLPDGFEGDIEYQTKDTQAQYLDHYTITEDGRLVLDEKPEEAIPFHGALSFHASNVCGSGPDGYMTDDDSPGWSREYVALFDRGRLLKIEGGVEPWPGGGRVGKHITRDEFNAAFRSKDGQRP
jgi:hypothetical protein